MRLNSKAIKILFSAGEASGDQHGANLFLALKQRCADIQGLGMGGEKMQQAGISIRYHSAQIAVIGVVEVIKHYTEIRRAFKQLQQLIVTEKPDLLICIDYKEFNLKLAQFAKKQQVKVLFYIGPQLWAWRPRRVVTYAQAVDKMAVIFPFETRYYEAEHVAVDYVGHPCVDTVYARRSKADNLREFALQADAPIIGLLPGSRTQEIKRLLPLMLQAAQLLKQQHPRVQFILPQAESIQESLLNSYLATANLPVQLIQQQRYEAISCCDAVMTSSGTATLEMALLGIPMVLSYRLSPLTYLLGRWLVQTPFIGLPNIIAGRKIVTELIQHQANAQNLFLEINRLLIDPLYAQTQREQLATVRQQLGKGGASMRVAELALEMLGLT
jgi:lipid-A-disaccharide synthase